MAQAIINQSSSCKTNKESNSTFLKPGIWLIIKTPKTNNGHRPQITFNCKKTYILLDSLTESESHVLCQAIVIFTPIKMCTQLWPDYYSLVFVVRKYIAQADLGSGKFSLAERQVISIWVYAKHMNINKYKILWVETLFAYQVTLLSWMT